MSTLTVRNVPEEAKHRFRQVAAAHGRSMEEHLRQLIIEAGASEPTSPLAATSGVRDMRTSFHAEPRDLRAESRERIERLIELGRGLEEFELPPRERGTIKDVNFS